MGRQNMYFLCFAQSFAILQYSIEIEAVHIFLPWRTPVFSRYHFLPAERRDKVRK
jgi:hypothetical protein